MTNFVLKKSGKQDLQAALGTISEFLDAANVESEELKNMAEDLRRSGRHLMWLAKQLDGYVDGRKRT